MRDEPTSVSLDIIDDVLVAGVQLPARLLRNGVAASDRCCNNGLTAESRKVASVALPGRKQQAGHDRQVSTGSQQA